MSYFNPTGKVKKNLQALENFVSSLNDEQLMVFQYLKDDGVFSNPLYEDCIDEIVGKFELS